MFSITVENFYGKERIKLFNPGTGEYLCIIPAFGGNIIELVLSKNEKLHHVIAGDEAIESLSGNPVNFYRGAKLSPFPNRIDNGKYVFEGKEHQLEQNNPPHALHGLCWNLPFTVKAELVTDNSAMIILQTDYDSIHKGYPFSYHIEIEYTLEENNFKCLTRILNTSEQSIPIGDGWHPYFTIGSKVDNLKLQLPPNKQIKLGKDMIPTGNYIPGTLFESPTLINNTRLDHCFELDTANERVETRLIDEQKNISIVIWQQASGRGYKFLQAYTPPDRNSIAIEPMSCAPDAFNNKNGLIVLLPKEAVEFCFGVNLTLPSP
jgi:aldose 1-epimerase